MRKKSKIRDKYVSLKQLAEELGLDRSNLRKYVLSHSVKPHKRRTEDSRSQLALAVTNEEANFIRQKRHEQGFLGNSKPVIANIGVFYVIQLVPELDPRRIKMGFADNIDSRLAQHRTAAPTAVLICTWPCHRSWERTIIDCLSIQHCRLILNEVFEYNNLIKMKSTADRLFSLLPNPNTKCTLSKHSPLGEKNVERGV